jgi:hypothetical protein
VMRKYLTPIGMILGTAALVWAGSARAEPPASMTYMTETPALIACDTRPQIDEIIAAIKAGKVKEKLAEMQNIVDEHGEPVCVYGKLPSVVFGESEHIGQIEDHDRLVDVWVANVGNHNAAFYVLWGEVVDSTGV